MEPSNGDVHEASDRGHTDDADMQRVSETQAASNMITAAAAISLYEIDCRAEIPASAVETVNTTIRMHGESRVVASMAEIGLQREKLGRRAFCAHV
jgi:hypothetical protein